LRASLQLSRVEAAGARCFASVICSVIRKSDSQA
jgi:hypothetical protein